MCHILLGEEISKNGKARPSASVELCSICASWQSVYLQSSCPIMPSSKHRLEIAGLVLKG